MEENVIQIKSGIMKKGWSEFKKTSYIWTRFYLESCYMHLCKWKYLASITDDSVSTWDKIIEETRTIPINFNEKSNM